MYLVKLFGSFLQSMYWYFINIDLRWALLLPTTLTILKRPESIHSHIRLDKRSIPPQH